MTRQHFLLGQFTLGRPGAQVAIALAEKTAAINWSARSVSWLRWAVPGT